RLAVAMEIEEVRSQLAGRRVDANIIPNEHRRKRLLVADMDSTIIGCECIDEIADFANIKPAVAAITERAMRGEIEFETALRGRAAMPKGLSESALDSVYRDRVRLNDGARVLVQTMAEHGAQTMLVSGGFTFFTSRVAADAGFARHQANDLIVENDELAGK